MFITKKRFERELEAAKNTAVNEVLKERWLDDRFREIHERIDNIEKKINAPKPVPGFADGGASK